MKVPKLNRSQIYKWHQVTKPHRRKIDLASIIWFWMGVEESNDWESIYENILSVICAAGYVDERKWYFFCRSIGRVSYSNKFFPGEEM